MILFLLRTENSLRKVFGKLLPSVPSPENVGGAQQCAWASQDRSFENFYLYDDLQGSQGTNPLLRPVQIMVGKSVATMGYLDREDTRRYRRSDTQASIFSKRQDRTEPDSLQAASGTDGSLSSDE